MSITVQYLMSMHTNVCENVKKIITSFILFEKGCHNIKYIGTYTFFFIGILRPRYILHPVRIILCISEFLVHLSMKFLLFITFMIFVIYRFCAAW